MTQPLTMQQHRERMLAQKAAQQKQPQDPRRTAAVGVANTPLVTAISDAFVAATTSESVAPTDELGHLRSPVQNIELRLSSQMERLKLVKAVSTKVQMKSEWLPEYHGYIDGCLATEAHGQNNLLMHLMSWAIDTGDYPLAVRIGQYGILNNMVMPAPYKRSVAEILAENCAEAFNADPQLAASHSDLIDRILETVRGEDIVDQVNAKIYKAKGIALADNQPVEALNAYKIALRLDPNVGVKKSIEQLERQVKKSNAQVSSPDAPSGSQDVITEASVSAVADPASTASSESDVGA